jgi:very-long-chain (3R)-3-hydroxyacyl-CoA dehydratase
MSNAVKYYLSAYNLVAFSFWAIYLVSFVTGGFVLNSHSLLLLNIAQGLAVLEVVHAILKWVKSPVGSTVAQVASRLLVVVLINMFLTVSLSNQWALAGIVIVSFAWSITELIRYSLYFLGTFNVQPQWLLWARYSFFIVLYPVGVSGEWCIILAPIIAGGLLPQQTDVSWVFYGYRVFALILFISYAYYFPVLYGYMWKQRKSKLQ